MTNGSQRFHGNSIAHKGVRMATSQHISIFLFCCNQKNKRRLKIEYRAQKVSLESRILKKKVRGKVNTLPLPRTVEKARYDCCTPLCKRHRNAQPFTVFSLPLKFVRRSVSAPFRAFAHPCCLFSLLG